MKEEFVIFKKFSNQNSVIETAELLKENNIEYLIEDISVNFDPILANNEFGKEYCLKLKKADFEKAEKLLIDQTQTEIDSVDKNYYLFSFTNDELIDVISKNDEWNEFDVSLAKKLLKVRGNEISEEKISEMKKERIIELSKPEEGQNRYIVLGYIFGVLGGLLGFFIGWHLMTYKKTLPNGEKIYCYSTEDRKHGNQILIISVICLLISILFSVLKN